MPIISGTVVASGLSPGNALNTHETHRAFYGKGGYRTVATLVERNQITPLRREEGMLVYVVNTGLIYILKPGAPLTGNTVDANWDLLETGGGGGGAVPITGTIATASYVDIIIGQISSFKITKYLVSLTTATKSFGEEIVVSKDHTELIVPGFSKIEYALLGTVDAVTSLLISGADLVLRITNNELVTLTYTLINDIGSNGGGHTIEDEGIAVAQQPILNFTGAGVSVADSGGKTVVTINGGSAPDATASVKGLVKLTNDLGGTADNPTVPGIETNAVVNRFRRGYNDTGVTIPAFKFVCLSNGYFTNYPKIKINDFSGPCLGVVTSPLATSIGDKVQYYGLLQFDPGIIDTTLIPIGTPVYVTNTGDLTLSYTRVLAGHTMSQATNPWILLNVQYNAERYLEYPFTSIVTQTFNHNFNRYPEVQIIEDTTNEDITRSVFITHPDRNSITIFSNTAISGVLVASCD